MAKSKLFKFPNKKEPGYSGRRRTKKRQHRWPEEPETAPEGLATALSRRYSGKS
jgi:hypothetical protein